ncbi:MAG: geranylgeranylglycerol-phosphate geranylgeranyltransferase [candidate division Zixibacteria bacterium]|nr:geranylgeranylglycerol-phosphate geranylgeranyltransferase [candidate division Zixibacteria bacterium]
MKSLPAYLSLIRIHNCLMASLGVAVGHYLSPGAGSPTKYIYAMAAAFFVCGFGNVVNDLLDIDSDRINHPARPLPSGRLNCRQAVGLAAMFLILSLALMIPLNVSGRVIVMGALVLVTWYNLALKHTAFFGNVAVSLLAGFTFILGGAEGGYKTIAAMPGAAVGAALAFLMHLAREIVKDIEDQTGDATVGGGTAVLKFGSKTATAAVWLVFLALAAGSVGAYTAGWFNGVYLTLVLGLVVLPLGVMLGWMSLSPDRRRCRLVSIILKLQMLIGTVALIIGKQY